MEHFNSNWLVSILILFILASSIVMAVSLIKYKKGGTEKLALEEPEPAETGPAETEPTETA